jgi:hypothetical protein
LFFILVHVPLTKVSAAWSFLTGFLCWFLDNRTKEKIYHGCAFLTRILTGSKTPARREGDQAWRLAGPPEEEAADLRAVVEAAALLTDRVIPSFAERYLSTALFEGL